MLLAPFGFVGGRHDGATGLQYLRARWYEPEVGRFTQVDPFPGMLGAPATQHPYAYGLNNPVRYTDPSGEFVLTSFGAALAIFFISGSIAAGAEWWFNQVHPLMRDCGLSLVEASYYKNLNLGAIAGAFVRGYLSSLLGAITIPLLLGVGTSTSFYLGIPLAFALGGISGVFSDFIGRRTEEIINGTTLDNTYDASSYISSFLWGGGFGILGYGVSYMIKVLTDRALIEAFRERAFRLLWDKFLKDGVAWQVSPGDDVLPANDLVSFAWNYWFENWTPSTPLPAGIRVHSSVIAARAPFDTAGQIFDLVLNDDAIQSAWDAP